MPSQLWRYGHRTAGDDFLISGQGGSTLNGNDGNDYLLGDVGLQHFTGTSNSFVSPFNIDDVGFWTRDEKEAFSQGRQQIAAARAPPS